MPNDRDRRLLRGGTVAALALFVATVAAACGSSSPTPSPTSAPPTAPPQPTVTPVASSPPSPSPTPATGFAFDAESVILYYQGVGFTCADPQPSSLAEGYTFTRCELVDRDGRTRVIGVVTDANDELADGFASVAGSASETVLEPTAALEHLAGFLGAMLGDVRGASLLEWLAGNLGEDYAETTVGDLRVATYIRGDDHSTLYLELATQAYIDSPAPSTQP